VFDLKSLDELMLIGDPNIKINSFNRKSNNIYLEALLFNNKGNEL